MLISCDRSATCILQLLLLCLVALLNQTRALEVDDACKILDQPGKCTAEDRCSVLKQLVLTQQLRNNQIPNCGTNGIWELICCPINASEFLNSLTISLPTNGRYGFDQDPRWIQPTSASSDVRPAERACRLYEAYARSKGIPIRTHIANGVAADFGEFPHMGAIGSRPATGNDQSDKLEYNCGATLIAERFVLTAAHCIARTDLHPEVVRFNFTDFMDPYQRFIEIPINQSRIIVPSTYRTNKIYDDIAVIELERDVPFSQSCRPTCLFTEPEAPENIPVFATGWGVTERRNNSDILLRVMLKIQPNSKCNDDFRGQGSLRRFDRGMIESQLCASDPEADQQKQGDTCSGDSGGPLVVIVDENYNIYRTIGIVSSGFSCGKETPGVYTRVSAYLDFIENIVWPQT